MCRFILVEISYLYRFKVENIANIDNIWISFSGLYLPKKMFSFSVNLIWIVVCACSIYLWPWLIFHRLEVLNDCNILTVLHLGVDKIPTPLILKTIRWAQYWLFCLMLTIYIYGLLEESLTLDRSFSFALSICRVSPTSNKSQRAHSVPLTKYT